MKRNWHLNSYISYIRENLRAQSNTAGSFGRCLAAAAAQPEQQLHHHQQEFVSLGIICMGCSAVVWRFRSPAAKLQQSSCVTGDMFMSLLLLFFSIFTTIKSTQSSAFPCDYKPSSQNRKGHIMNPSWWEFRATGAGRGHTASGDHAAI